MGRLDGKVAVITGGVRDGRGDGPSLRARGRARRHRRPPARRGEAVASSIGPDCQFVACDVSRGCPGHDPAAVSAWGRLDVMYNNAGIGGGEGSLVDCTEDVWQRTIDVDLKGVWLGMKHCIPHMIASGGGSIVSTASIAAIYAFPASRPTAPPRPASPTRVAALEYAAHNIRANAILPGGILTPISTTTPPS